MSRFITQTRRFVAVPTFGCFVPGYVLIVPRKHVLSFGLLGSDALGEAETMVRDVSERIAAAYAMPVLGFEYGNNVPAGRRVEHAHWHLLPSAADLAGWLGRHMNGHTIDSLANLPSDIDLSYIAVRSPHGHTTVYPVQNRPHQRIRLRRAVAELDPRVDAADWDFDERCFPELIRQTVDDLASVTPGRTP